jgi:hypothetical protein
MSKLEILAMAYVIILTVMVIGATLEIQDLRDRVERLEDKRGDDR